MKYIRTKNDIYDLEDLRLWNISFMIVDDFIDFNSAGRHKIIKQADNIEELCDEFVRVSKSVHDFLVSDDIPTKKYSDTEIYGAIWTEKGLIYIAKLNEKGELKLL